MATRATAVLPASDAKMQFQTPFVTTELNRKSIGIVPAGIYRGFNVTAFGFNVTVAADPGTGDSVAACRTINASLVENQYNVTVRHEGSIVIDYSGVTVSPTVLVLEARYDLTSPTPVEGLTEVRIKAVDPGDVMPYHVVLAEVTGSPGPPIVNLSPADVTGGPLVVPNQLSPLGSSGSIATLQKTDGNASTGSAVFVPIPGTVIAFTQIATGPALFWVSCTLLPIAIVNTLLGIRIDGATDLPLHGTNIHTFAGGVAVFEYGTAGMTFQAALPAGPHTAEVVFARNDAFGAGVQANPSRPFNFSILHT